MGSALLRDLIGRRRAEETRSSGRVVGALHAFSAALLLLLLVVSVGCGGSSSSAQLAVAVSPTSASLALGGVQQFTATVTNDSTNRGVTWSLTQGGISCSPGCGTVSPGITTSGSPTTYTAPAVTPPLSTGVTLTATAVANTSVNASVAIVVAGSIAVSVLPATATIALSQARTFVGVASNDTTNNGLTWGLTQNGSACSPDCGTIAAVGSFSCGTATPPSGGFCTENGGAVTYTAPSSAPSSATVLLTATDIAAPRETGYSTITIQSSVGVSLSATYANVPINGTQTITATLANDPTNAGVTWALSQNGSGCSASACGSVSPTTTASGTATTYTAPSAPTTVTLTATSVADSTESAYATINVVPISVTVYPTTAILYANETTPFTATVSNDIAEKGVTWSLEQNGSACTSASCGAIKPTSTLGGVSTTYTAPSSISSATTVTVVATSVTDTSESASATVSLYPPVSVTIAPSSYTVALSGRNSFTATVTNDPTEAGVAWRLTQAGKACSPACGTVSPTPTTGNVSSTVYLAPSTMPSSSTVTLTANSQAELSQSDTATITLSSSASATQLSGNYAFLFSGNDSAGPVVMAGSFTADGAGNVTGGEADVNRASGADAAVPLNGSYTVAADGTGILTLTAASQPNPLATFHFALNGSGDQARFIESDTTGMHGWGTMSRQSGEISAASLDGNYAFSSSGSDPGGGRWVLAGRFHADGAGRISAGVLDSNDGGNVGTGLPFTGSYSVSSSGRGTLTADTPDGAMHWALYIVSPGQLVMVSTDPRAASPVNGGEAVAQTAGQTASGFTPASLRGTSVVSLAGMASDGVGSKVEAGLVTFDGAGTLDYSIDQNNGGKIGVLSGSGSYSVEPNGRVTMWFSSVPTPLVSYLVAPNQGMVVGTGSGASAGSLDAQSAGPFSDASLCGGYISGTSAAPSSGAALESGVMTSKGLGLLDGMVDSTAPGHMLPNGLHAVYSVAASGRGVLGSTGSVLYLISPFQAVIVDVKPGDAAGTLLRFEK